MFNDIKKRLLAGLLAATAHIAAGSGKGFPTEFDLYTNKNRRNSLSGGQPSLHVQRRL